jgi:signal transduction histidine kinase
MSVESAARRVQVRHRSAQPVSAVAALVLLIGVLASARYFSPPGPAWIGIVLLGVGLAAGPVSQLVGGEVGRRLTQPVAAAAAITVMGVLILALSRDRYLSPRWPLQLSVVLLGVGLAAGPLSQHVGGEARQRLARPVATAVVVTAVVLLLSALSGDPFLSPKWPLQLSVVLLGVGLATAPLSQLVGGEVWPRLARPVATAAVGAALVVLLGALAGSPYLDPKWQLEVSAVLVALGLVAGPLAQRTAEPRERVLSQRVDELSRTRSGALDVQASELRRIERDLHDGAQARLVALSMKLGRAEDRYRDDPETAALLREAREDATAAIRELRELARGISPPVLTDRGLEAAVRSLAQRSGAEVAVSGELARRPVPVVETAAYFVVAESLTNAAKHAPGARVEVRLDERGGDLFVEVTDFGPGGADPAGGLIGLRQRVEALDGALHVTSPAGVGTQVEAVLPCGW